MKIVIKVQTVREKGKWGKTSDSYKFCFAPTRIAFCIPHGWVDTIRRLKIQITLKKKQQKNKKQFQLTKSSNSSSYVNRVFHKWLSPTFLFEYNYWEVGSRWDKRISLWNFKWKHIKKNTSVRVFCITKFKNAIRFSIQPWFGHQIRLFFTSEGL